MKKYLPPLIFFVFVYWFSFNLSAEEISTGTLRWGGHIMVRYAADQTAGSLDSFSINRAYLRASYKFDSRLTGTVSFLANQTANPRQALGHTFLDYRAADFLHVQAGQILIPTSHESLTSPADLDFLNRSYTILQLYPTGYEGADIGAQVLGNWKNFSGAVAVVNGAGPNVSDDTQAKTVVSRLAADWDNFALGGYAYLGDQASGFMPSVIKNRFGGELRLGPREFPIRAEYHRGQDGTIDSQGWFVQGETVFGIFSQEAYRKWLWLQRLHVAIRLERWDPDVHVQNDKETITSFALHYYPESYLRLSAQYDVKQEETLAAEIPNNAFLANLQVKF